MIPIFRPYYDEREEQAVIATLRSGWTGLGPKTAEFESKFAEQFKAKYAVSCNSATTALLISARIMGVKPGDEVILPSMTFVSTAHIVKELGAKPIFCDIEESTMMLDWEDVKRNITNKTKIIIAVSYGGQLFENIPDLGIPILFDCAHAAGPYFNASNKVCCWSFHAVKNISTADGGMITTDDENFYKEARKLRWLGIDKDTWSRSKDKYSWDYDVKEIGYKAHGNDILNTLGIVQLSKLQEAHEKRLKIVNLYNQLLNGYVELPKYKEDSAWHLYVIKTENRDQLSLNLAKAGFSTGVHYKPIHLYDCYDWKLSLQIVEKVWKEILTLPLYPSLEEENVVKICNSIKSFKDESCHL